MKFNKEKIKSFCEANKTLLILVGILVLMMGLVFYLFFANNDNNDLSEGFEKQQVENNTTNAQDDNPYKMENPFVPSKANPDNNATLSFPHPPLKNEDNLSQEALILEENTTLNSNPIKAPSLDTQKEKEVLEKPEDMVSFLKGLQEKIELKDKAFVYELKEYTKGDKFLGFYEIEDIGLNYIRFKDEDYSYNLRFERTSDE